MSLCSVIALKHHFIIIVSFKLYLPFCMNRPSLSELMMHKINFKQPLSAALKTYDVLVGNMGIDRVGLEAMQAYQMLIGKYLDRQVIPIHQGTIRKQKSKLRQHARIEDPENGQMFSFSKQRASTFESHMKPRTLFVDAKHTLSQNGLYQAKTNHFRSENIEFDFQDKHKDFIKGATEHSPQRKDNSQKQLFLRHYLLQIRFRQLMICLKKQTTAVKYLLKRKSGEYKYEVALLKKGFTGLQQIRNNAKKLANMVAIYKENKEECLLQETFLEWKQWAKQSPLEKVREEDIENKIARFSMWRFIYELRAAIRRPKLLCLASSYKSQNNQLICLKKRNGLLRFQLWFTGVKQFRYKKFNLNIKIVAYEGKMLISLLRANQIATEQHERTRAEQLIKLLQGRRLLRTLKYDFELVSVYWKQKQKILFISLIFRAIKESLLRKGYQQHWMNQLDDCLERIDQKLGYYAKKYRLKQLFNGIRHFLVQERYSIDKVKQVIGRRVLSQLMKNHIYTMVEQSIVTKGEQLQQILRSKKYINTLYTMTTNSRYSLNSRKVAVSNNNQISCKTYFLRYLQAYSLSSKYYSAAILAFTRKWEQHRLQQIYYEMKKVLRTEVINRQIVREYRKYREDLLLKRMLRAIGDYVFQAKILAKRVGYLRKMRREELFNAFLSKLIQNFQKHSSKRYQTIKQATNMLRKQILKRMIAKMFQINREKVLRQDLTLSVICQYAKKIKWKIFTAFKCINEQRRKEKILQQHINAFRALRLKKRSIDTMVGRLLRNIILRHIVTVIERIFVRDALDNIQNYVANHP